MTRKLVLNKQKHKTKQNKKQNKTNNNRKRKKEKKVNAHDFVVRYSFKHQCQTMRKIIFLLDQRFAKQAVPKCIYHYLLRLVFVDIGIYISIYFSIY